ncbi:uncharacterized protein SPPG_02425 [Spizellomyces punctatus DAOM BR117]|uniref:Uncharacterized protein n=1 Tax=Spizellomyces punctatus (strain DAOM BR117) TaxID=645134 RepID=A0A0L0HKD0_SPIPD|nr:uncharacterized protein SPPG_02425 [Spizellomyces punctatus DAOM BR117]KND01916.1 hypothetical protein SPPG_02425 [Spizellomyces punctatus DAOM BR117]|eukprot:XP_016609955.1 hypothetical protein SPPG_02425 [Spizellomyces punctatus DAOM BR117]
MCKRQKYTNRQLKTYERADGSQYYVDCGIRKTVRSNQRVVTKVAKTIGCCRGSDGRTGKLVVRAGQDKCHIISRKNGGSDHPNNLYACSSSVNRSRQHRFDHLNCRDVGKERCVKAIVASRVTGCKTTYAQLMRESRRS